MINFLILLFISAFSISGSSQIAESNVYIAKSCPGEKAYASIYVNPYIYGDFEFCFKGSNIPGLKAFLNGKELDSTTYITFNDETKIEIEFQIPENLEGREIYYSSKRLKKAGEIHQSKIPIHLATYQVNSRQSYIQTFNACKDQVQLAFPFYGTQTGITLYDITDGTPKKIANATFICCSFGNIITIPKDTKGKFMVKAYGCHTSEIFEFEINTLKE